MNVFLAILALLSAHQISADPAVENESETCSAGQDDKEHHAAMPGKDGHGTHRAMLGRDGAGTHLMNMVGGDGHGIWKHAPSNDSTSA